MHVTTKEQLHNLIDSFPEDMPVEAILEEMTLRFKINRGLEQLARGEEIDFEMVKQEFLSEDKTLS